MTSHQKIPIHMQTTILEKTQERSTDSVHLEPYLVVLSGLDQGNQYKLNRQFNTIGRTTDADIRLLDPKISRKHCVLIIHPDSIVLEDYQSTNGCYVNDIRIESQTIEPTARIRVGSTIMKVEYKKASEVQSEKALYVAANTDALTKVLNRHAFMTRAEDEVAISQQFNTKIAVIMCDVDHFKKTNDTYGHPAGDHVLVELAEILNSEMRKDDLLARYGGEEFIILLRNTDTDAVSKWAERIREKVESFEFIFDKEVIPTTLSIGICNKNGGDIPSLNTLIKEADDNLYKAKNNGRNQVVIS